MRVAVAAVLLAGALPAPTLAQAYQCAVPRTIAPLQAPEADGPVRKVPVGGYTLAASWSPDYCKTSGETRSMQCSNANGRFGFILHGLWPEARQGAPPQWCARAPVPSPALIRRHLCMTPSPDLLAHEWAKHGTCMARRPETYFKVSAILWNAIRWPDADRLSRQPDLTAGDLREAFLALNRGWRRDSVGILVSRSGWLRELRLCYGKDFRPAPCPAQQFGPADAGALKIWRGM
mgnify:CR=1 FL=1